MSTYLTNQNAVLSAPGLTGAAVTYPKTIPQLAAAGRTFLLFAFPCFLHTVTHTQGGGPVAGRSRREGRRQPDGRTR